MSHEPGSIRFEARRLQALRETGLLDSPSDPAFDRVTRLVSRLLRAPVSLVTLVDEGRLFFKSQVGLPEPFSSRRETPCTHSFCRGVVESGRPLVVADAREHPALRDSPLVRELKVVSYLGVPLTTRDGLVLGTLCVIDAVPRTWCGDDLATLDDLAAMVMTEVELRVECARHARSLVERGEAEARLSQSERRFRALFDGAFQFVGLLSTDGILLEANRSSLDFVGAELDEVVGLPFPETPWWKGSEATKARLEAAIADAAAGQFVRFEADHTGADGRLITVDFSLSPVRDESGQVVRLIPEARDVTERKRAEEAIREREGLLELAAEVAGLGVWDWDLDTGQIHWSRELHRIAGLTPGSFGGTFDALQALIHVDDRAAVRDSCLAAHDDHSAYQSEHRMVRPDGSVRWIESRGRFLYDESTGAPTRIIGVCLDITARKALERQARDRAQRLAEADRRKDEFLAMLAHELRNPLASISHAVKVLELRDGEPALRVKMRALIAKQVRSLARLVDDLLDVSRITRGKIRLRREPVDLAEMVQRALVTTRPLVMLGRLQLAVELPARPVRLLADPLRLEQVLVNLLNNAAKYTDPGGEIRVEAVVEGPEVVVKVSDTGMGIGPELLPLVFDAFTQADQSLDRIQAGLGIGLTLVRSLVRIHGGSVDAWSEGPGLGSTFTVRLPTYTPDLSASPAPALPAERPSARTPASTHRTPPRGLRVLLVDDNIPATESLALILSAWGHQPTVCHDGRAAVDVAREVRPEVVLLDIGLPGMDGYSVARLLRERPEHAGVVLIAVSGYGRNELRERAEDALLDHHCLKPVDLDVLHSLLHSIASDGQRASSPSPIHAEAASGTVGASVPSQVSVQAPSSLRTVTS